MADNSLKVSELARFARNLENFSKTSPEEAMYHRFHGILESQSVTLQCCGVITVNKSVSFSDPSTLKG